MDGSDARRSRPRGGVLAALLAAVATLATLASGAAPTSDAAEALDLSAMPPSKLGGPGSSREYRSRPFNQPARTLTNEQRRSFGLGAEIFRDPATTETGAMNDLQGIGPLFVQASCVTCHVDGLTAGGEGSMKVGRGDPGPGLVVRTSGEVDDRGGPSFHQAVGIELQTKAIKGFDPEASVATTWENSTFTYPDGTTRQMTRPKLAYASAGGTDAKKPLAADEIHASPRVATPLLGLWLLEAIPESSLESAADPDDSNGDGVSGEVQRVWDEASASMTVGRIGWKAGKATTAAQTAGASAYDMGVTSAAEHSSCDSDTCSPVEEPAETEMSDRMMSQLVLYTRAIAVPESKPLRNPTDAMVQGQRQFVATGCASCHTASQVAGPSDLPNTQGVKFYPFTDLLLHDMGSDLADDRVEFLASGSEWRTPPLWGMNLRKSIGFGSLLHDGRAATVEEAILWHGGEAAAAKQRFTELDADQRAHLIAFVEAL